MSPRSSGPLLSNSISQPPRVAVTPASLLSPGAKAPALPEVAGPPLKTPSLPCGSLFSSLSAQPAHSLPIVLARVRSQAQAWAGRMTASSLTTAPCTPFFLREGFRVCRGGFCLIPESYCVVMVVTAAFSHSESEMPSLHSPSKRLPPFFFVLFIVYLLYLWGLLFFFFFFYFLF